MVMINRERDRAAIGRYLRRLLLATSIVSWGCAGATVTPQENFAPTSAAPAGRPEVIVVHNFAVSASDVQQSTAPLERLSRKFSSSNSDQEKLAVGKQAAQTISDSLTKQLEDLGFTVVQQPAGTPVAGNALVIDGEFVNVDEGNRLRRLVIGFGAGASKLDTQVQVARVSDGQRQVVMDFKTEANSGRMPGAAVTMGAGAAAQGGATLAMGAANAGIAGAKGYTSMVDSLAKDTAGQISGYLAQYFQQQGWITAEQAKQVKSVKLSPAAAQ
jgi:hypothetical protein